nr:MAG TPA: hypothetical protein [Bacteriophage sp.]DAH37806.1 MAG TPA: hypothetical protein [Caudoviricetes sp.]
MIAAFILDLRSLFFASILALLSFLSCLCSERLLSLSNESVNSSSGLDRSTIALLGSSPALRS